MTNLPPHLYSFNFQFENGQQASAVRMKPNQEPVFALKALGLSEMRPVIFISGGASEMSEQDRRAAYDMMSAVVEFAEEQHAIIVDGGTESGVMQLVGEIRQKRGYSLPLLGVSPLGKVGFPGYDNPHQEAYLEDSHTHFVLVEGETWGAETETILHIVYTICGDGKMPSVGILINGGKIAMKEVYLASTTAHRIPMLILEGSGRAADEISTAFRTGKTSQRILQAILAGGDIELVGTVEGPKTMRTKLEKKFKSFQKK